MHLFVRYELNFETFITHTLVSIFWMYFSSNGYDISIIFVLMKLSFRSMDFSKNIWCYIVYISYFNVSKREILFVSIVLISVDFNFYSHVLQRILSVHILFIRKGS